MLEQDRVKLGRHFAAELRGEVTITLFKRPSEMGHLEHDSPVAGEAEKLLNEVCGLSDKLSLNIVDSHSESEQDTDQDVLTPTVVVDGRPSKNGHLGEKGIRYVGVPKGNEFPNFVQVLVDVSRDESGLTEASRTVLSNLDAQIHLRVFVTPT